MSQRALIELFHGKGTHADPIVCVEDLPQELAARTVAGFPHSVGDLVFHMNYWMDYELRRIRGERAAYPEHAAESWPSSPLPGDAQEWDRLRRQMNVMLAELSALAQSAADLSREIAAMHAGHKKIAGTLEAVLWQTITHNSYHVGQIVMIRRILGAWPPRGGGDTW